VQTLISIRHALIHYEPVWASTEEEKIDKRILSLQQEKKFAINPQKSQTYLPFASFPKIAFLALSANLWC
jgi:hypothetical protein